MPEPTAVPFSPAPSSSSSSTSSSLLELLLLQCGDVESNPGPPRRKPVDPPKKEAEKDSGGNGNGDYARVSEPYVRSLSWNEVMQRGTLLHAACVRCLVICTKTSAERINAFLILMEGLRALPFLLSIWPAACD